MRPAFQFIFASLFFASAALAQERLLPLIKTQNFQTSSAESVSLQPAVSEEHDAELTNATSVKFEDFESTSEESFKFKIQNEQAHRTKYITLGKTAHNALLRKALLRKLGYDVAPAAHLPEVQVHFKDRTEKKTFLSKLEQRTNADSKRWVKEEDKEFITLQDVVISEVSDPRKPDLLSGQLNHFEMIGRPDLQSLIVPYTLVHVPESINLFSWIAGTIYNEGVKVDYPNSDEFNPTAEDIQKILFRIADFSREDWTQIAKAARLPKEVELLLVEKLIARRNSLVSLFSMNVPELPFEPRISSRPDLLNGQVTKEEWDGYASHFSSGTPDSPLNPGEMFAFTKSNLFSTILNNAVNQLNNLAVFKGTEKLLETGLNPLLQNGKKDHQNLALWGFPFASGALIFSRDIVTGGFMGTENVFQLSDQFGIRLTLGAQLATDALPAPVGLGIKGAVSISRTYSHLRPIKSVRKSNRYGYQNIAVPYFMRASANKLNLLFDDGFEKLPAEEKLKKYREAMDDFKHKLAPGESVIITDSLVANGKLTTSVNLYQLIDLSLAGEVNELVLHRLHIYRKDENNFQIYKDDGQATQPSFGIEIGVRRPTPKYFLPISIDKDEISSATLPILRAKWGRNLGHTKVQFYPLQFSSGESAGEDLGASIEQLRILHQTLLHGSTEVLKKHVQPYVIENEFFEKNMQERLLFFSERRLKTESKITVTSPTGEKHSYLRDFYGRSDAFDYKNTVANVLDFANEMILHNQVDFDSDTSINPGYTTNGRANNQLLTFEAERLDDGTLRDSFVKVAHIKNGWKLSKEKLQKILDQFARDYGAGEQLFAPTALNETEKMFLYRISLEISLNENAIKHLTRLSEAEVRDIFARHGVKLDHRLVDERIVKRIRYFKNTHSAKSLMKAIAIADRLLPAEGFIEFLGGRENVFITAKIEGFRKGDEKGDTPILSNTIGIQGTRQNMGPLSAIRTQLGMTEGEFLSLWILGRIL